MATYDPELCARLARGASVAVEQYRRDPWRMSDPVVIAESYERQAVMADQLDAAREHIEFLVYGVAATDKSILAKQLAGADRDLAYWKSQFDELHARLAEMTRKRDRLREELDHATAHNGGCRRMVNTVMVDRDALRLKNEKLQAEIDRIAAVRDRAMSGCASPTMSPAEFVEWLDDFERHASERSELRRTVDTLQAQLEAVAPIVDAALGSYGSQRGGHFGQPRPTDAMLELADAIDTYRARLAGDP